MRRKLFNLAAAVSLMLCVAAGVFWVRSYLARTAGPVVDFAGARGVCFRAAALFARAERSAFIGSSPGRVLFIQQSSSSPLDASHCGVFGMPDYVTAYSPPDVVRGSGFLGFGDAVTDAPVGSREGHLRPLLARHRRDLGPAPVRAAAAASGPALDPRGPLPRLWLRPARHARPLPGMRCDFTAHTTSRRMTGRCSRPRRRVSCLSFPRRRPGTRTSRGARISS
jgi:hypothetical protein